MNEALIGSLWTGWQRHLAKEMPMTNSVLLKVVYDDVILNTPICYQNICFPGVGAEVTVSSCDPTWPWRTYPLFTLQNTGQECSELQESCPDTLWPSECLWGVWNIRFCGQLDYWWWQLQGSWCRSISIYHVCNQASLAQLKRLR